ncbi:unnamed protein product [Closterium sp. NIES-54]
MDTLRVSSPTALSSLVLSLLRAPSLVSPNFGAVSGLPPRLCVSAAIHHSDSNRAPFCEASALSHRHASPLSVPLPPRSICHATKRPITRRHVATKDAVDGGSASGGGGGGSGEESDEDEEVATLAWGRDVCEVSFLEANTLVLGRQNSTIPFSPSSFLPHPSTPPSPSSPLHPLPLSPPAPSPPPPLSPPPTPVLLTPAPFQHMLGMGLSIKSPSTPLCTSPPRAPRFVPPFPPPIPYLPRLRTCWESTSAHCLVSPHCAPLPPLHPHPHILPPPSQHMLGMSMESTSVLVITWQLRGYLVIPGGLLDARVTSTFTLNQISGQVINHRDQWDVASSALPIQLAFWASRLAWSTSEAIKDGPFPGTLVFIHALLSLNRSYHPHPTTGHPQPLSQQHVDPKRDLSKAALSSCAHLHLSNPITPHPHHQPSHNPSPTSQFTAGRPR